MRRIGAGKAAGESALSLTRGGAGCAVGWDWPGAGSGGEASPSVSFPPRPPRASDEAACLVVAQRRAKLERHEQPGRGVRDDQSQSRSALHAVLVALGPWA